MTSSLDAVGKFLADQAMQGAADYLKAHDLQPTDAVLGRIVGSIRARCKAALAEALQDGKEALDAGPGGAAFAPATMAATFRLVGIEAARDTMEG